MSATADYALPHGYELRALEEDDAQELHALIERNRSRLARWIHWARGQTPQDTHAFIGRARRMEQEGSGLSRGVLCCGRLAGVVGITVDRANRSAAIGYWLDEASEGRGVMTAAVAALADDGFDRWRLRRVEIRADVENVASRAVAERLGFELEGIARQAYHVGDERYSDDAVYSMLASDPARAALAERQAIA
ncbi:MAG TPA: GNAT family protein [Solirubrobacteraceae bacterium]|nr:GNAT family protein [Solirubrobacteraceae bacterium]